jgi:NAD(P) transhydrogenase subunit beta
VRLPDPLFAMDHTLMVYGDGKKAVIEMTTALKQDYTLHIK